MYILVLYAPQARRLGHCLWLDGSKIWACRRRPRRDQKVVYYSLRVQKVVYFIGSSVLCTESSVLCVHCTLPVELRDGRLQCVRGLYTGNGAERVAFLPLSQLHSLCTVHQCATVQLVGTCTCTGSGTYVST